MRTFTAPDGIGWQVTAPLHGGSNLLVTFRHPAGTQARMDRYAWYNRTDPEARNVTANTPGADLLGGLSEERLALLFRRSMRIAASDSTSEQPVTHAG